MYKQLEKVTAELDLDKPVYYYDTDFGVSVCLLVHTDKSPVARGVAICSPFDVFDKTIGRELALCRALRAIKKMDTTDPIIPNRFSEHRSFYPRKKEEEAIFRLSFAADAYEYKSTYLPNLKYFEGSLLGDKSMCKVR